MPKKLPPIETLHKLLRYEPDTGDFYWRKRDMEFFASEGVMSGWNVKFSGRLALTANLKGYRRGSILGDDFLAHRVAWAMHYGEAPEDQIDHINGVRSDNRIENLRCVTNRENSLNRVVSPRNTSGYTGVTWWPKRGVWKASIMIDYKHIHLGYFDDPAEASKVRQEAERKYGFHENRAALKSEGE